jgi:drug/metabolite transporter (DMT)-like permease
MATDAETLAAEIEPQSEAGDGMTILGVFLIVIGICSVVGGWFFDTSVESSSYDPLTQSMTSTEVTNLAKQQTQLLIELVGALLTIMGTLLYGFGKVIKQLARRPLTP